MESKFNDKRVYISLGWNCYPRMIAVGHMNERKSEDGYKTCPFDLMASYYPSLCNLFEHNLDDIHDTNNLFVSDIGRITNKVYGFGHNHDSPNHYGLFGTSENWESPDYYVKNNFEKFKERYVRRVNNLREYLNSGKEIVFFINRYNSVPIEIEEIISRKYPTLNFKIVYHYDNNHQKELEYTSYLSYYRNMVQFGHPTDRIIEELQRFIKPLIKEEIVGKCIPFGIWMKKYK